MGIYGFIDGYVFDDQIIRDFEEVEGVSHITEYATY